MRRRRALGRWLPVLAMLVWLLGPGLAQATVYEFSGKDVYTCTLAEKEKVYTCPYPAYLEWNDSVIIGNNYTLKVTNNVTVTYNQGLTMGNNAKLIVTGNLDIKGVNPANLKVSGGDIEVGGTFSMGALAQTITGNISAGAVQLGTDRVTITGNVTSKGVVNISSSSRITGNVSGTVVTTDSSVTITGDVKATSKFTLASGGSVTGDVIAPVFDMLASNSKVTGDITATTSLTMGTGSTVTGSINTAVLDMQASGIKVTGPVTATKSMSIGSGNSVTGNVDTGDLVLQSSNAIITGNARVNWATLESQGRVTGIIYCKNGTAVGKCDCVTNNSGYAVNTANGPRCEGPAPKAPHHFLITHDGAGDTCVPEKVTITACANATCTAPHYAGTVTGSLFGDGFTIGANTGSVVVNATRFVAGSVDLVVGNTTLPTACYRPNNNTNSCSMNFSGGTKLKLTVPAHAAGTNGIKALIEAVKPNDEKTACVAALQNTTHDVQYRCNYSKPKTGTLALALGDKSLSCEASGVTADPKTVSTAFGANGSAELAIKYLDAGEVQLNATLTTEKGTVNGTGSLVTAPASFLIEPAGGIIRAGADFALKLTARNVAGATTQNFDTAGLLGAGAQNHVVALGVDCHLQGGNLGTLASAPPTFAKGVASFSAAWSDVGNIDMKASLSNFLGSGLNVASSTAEVGQCSGKAGPFIPAYFQVELADARSFYYSGEPFPLRVSAMNKAGAVTSNYATALKLSEEVTLTANDKDGNAFATAPGGLANAKIAADKFENGVAPHKPAYTFSTWPSAPTRIRLRASNGKTDGADVSSSVPASAEAAIPLIRTGRLRIGSRFGGLKTSLTIPLTAEYWTGKSWLLNSDDVYTLIPQSTIALKPTVSGMAILPSYPIEPGHPGKLKLANGATAFDLRVTAGGPGPVEIAVNLGNSMMDNSCIGATVGTGLNTAPGAGIPWLRPVVTGCGTTMARDPSGRATFGVYTPENRRIIHVREVFN
ncbi:polymer-forming cytoskeletal protein [Massilia sp. IC2-477]|uniref:polymer-forming cytoskeletal protein n=1 Tax=Massilia sp. IC2-477 TaxID=2887198 RepID=UPI001D116568|nr:polymer-forming cytoskeletal protein [Massilia sp. IC2-477]MCC2954694.1 polymer-forming cytoskeletal protein [Massilia sp. IC2-477]